MSGSQCACVLGESTGDTLLFCVCSAFAKGDELGKITIGVVIVGILYRAGEGRGGGLKSTPVMGTSSFETVTLVSHGLAKSQFLERQT